MRALRGSRGSHARRARPRGSIPSGSDVAQSLCGAGPRGSTRGPRRSGRVSIVLPAQFARVPRRSRGPCGLAGPFHQEAMWPSTRVLEEARERV